MLSVRLRVHTLHIEIKCRKRLRPRMAGLRKVQTFSAEQGPYTLGTPYMCAKKFYEVKVAC